MRRMSIAAAALLAVGVIGPLGAQPSAVFEVGVTVVDADGRPMTGLTRDDFTIADDGVPASISSFAAVDADSATLPDEGRFVVLLLADWPAPIMPRIRQVAALFADRMRGTDVVAAVAFSGDRVATAINAAEVRRQIDGVRSTAPVRRSAGRSLWPDPSDACTECGNFGSAAVELRPHTGQPATPFTVPAAIASLSAQIARVEHRVKTIVCIGPVRLFDVRAGQAATDGAWLDTIQATSRANVVVDAIDVPGTAPYDGSRGLAADSGGRVFADSADAARAVDAIWQASGHYYLLGYAVPAGTAGTTRTARHGAHEVTIGVKRAGATVWARRWRA